MRNLLCLGLALAALFVFAFTAGAADGTKAKEKSKKAPTVRGVIANLKAEKDKDAGEITVTIQKKAKQGEKAPEPEKKTIKVPEGTKVEMVSGKKGETTTTAGSFKDLKTGERISVTLEGDMAQEIKIRVKGKKK
jgi:Skp family chaperone for outer membrane proteins